MKYILFIDSDKEEIRTFSEGIESLADNNCTIYVARSDYGQKNKFINLLRYIKYFFAPFIFFTKRYKCDILLGWQQFYALNLVFFCRLFHTKKRYNKYFQLARYNRVYISDFGTVSGSISQFGANIPSTLHSVTILGLHRFPSRFFYPVLFQRA